MTATYHGRVFGSGRRGGIPPGRLHRATVSGWKGRTRLTALTIAVLLVGALLVWDAVREAEDDDGPGSPVSARSPGVDGESPSTDDAGTPVGGQPPTVDGGLPYRAFEARSWWNTPLSEDAPENPHEELILDHLATGPQSRGGCLRLAGAGHSPWGQPVYWAGEGDPSYDVGGFVEGRPPELDQLRIPEGARSASNSDGSMTVFDVSRGYVAMLTDAIYDEDADTWSTAGASVTYLQSNGLHVRTGLSDDERNTGTHRGNNGATVVTRWDMVKAGRIDHVLKVASGPELAKRWVFPMIGSDGDYTGTDPGVPPSGLRLRLRPSLDLESMGLRAEALVIAQALQRYGMYLGDSGGTTALKLEDTVTEGRGQLWGLHPKDLCSLPFDPAYWDVLPEGFDPSRLP